MNKYQGFTFIELLIYIAVSSFLVIIVVHFTSIVQRSVTLQQNSAIVQTGVYAGIDSFARDCVQAPSNVHAWISCEPSSIAWLTDEGSVGFEFKHGNFIRISRSKDSFSRLKGPCSSLLIPHVIGSFQVHKLNGIVQSIGINMHSNSTVPWSISRKFLVRIGRIV